MQSLKIAAAAGALALMAAAGAHAQGGFQGSAKLAAPLAQPSTTTLANGVTWSCQGDTCVGEAQRYNSLYGPREECRLVARALGTLVAYQTRGRTLTAGDLKACNSGVTASAATTAGQAAAH